MMEDNRDGPSRGVWKMVYADFTTAMMAFFLVLWLASTASEAQRDLLADYFNPVAVSREQSGADGILSGRAADTEGGSLSAYGTETPRTVAAPPVIAEMGREDNPPFTGVEMQATAVPNRRFMSADGDTVAQDRLDEVEKALRIALERHSEATGLRDVILIERLPQEVRVQISDNVGFLMFNSGSADLSRKAENVFRQLGMALRDVPHTVRIAGHTDAVRYAGRGGNWGLSAARANAAREMMTASGMPRDRVEAVEGKADRELLIADDPYDPRNRRITVSILANVAPSSDLLFTYE